MEKACLVISGFLGSGKTTYINSLLRNANGLRLGILVNDFGNVPIDYDLIESADENIIELSGGCVCCTYGGDLLSSLTQMMARAEELDALVIETSGLALPGIIASSVRFVPGIKSVGVLVLVDGLRLPKLIDDKYLSDTVVRQIQDADLVLVTKTSSADQRQRSLVEEGFTRHGLRPTTVHALPAAELLDRISNLAEHSPPGRTTLDASIFSRPLKPAENHLSQVVSVTLQVTGVHEPNTLINSIRALKLPIVRAKGIFMVASGGYVVLQHAGDAWEITPRNEPPTKCGLTFFFAAVATEKPAFVAKLAEVLNRQ